jgi:Cu-Zn family superoxide dismutase
MVMKKIGFQLTFLCTALLAACGGKSKPTMPPEPPVSNNESLPAEEQPTPMVAGTEQTADTAESMREPPAEPMPPPPVVAVADMMATKDGAVIGAFTFEKAADSGMITIAGQFAGLSAGKHALYIHEQGDCSDKGKHVGAHLNPTKAKHGPPASSARHAGDFGNVEVDASGNAIFMMKTDSITMEADRPDSILSRAIVVHAKADDKKGSGGAIVACGVINLKP